MRFSLEEMTARVVNVNPRPENVGDQKRPCAELKLEVELPNKELNQFKKGLLEIVYQQTTKGQKDMLDMTELRFPELQPPFKWNDQVVGGTVTIHQGIDEKSNIQIENCIIKGFEFEPKQGGTVVVTFSARFHPANEKQIGRICLLNGTEVPISVSSPTVREQEKLQRDMLEEDEKVREKKKSAKDPEPAEA